MIHIGHLDINVVQHCTNRCVACSHASPFAAPYYMSMGTFITDLRVLGHMLRCRCLHIVGGEPLLHPELPEMIQQARAIGIAEDVVVITNGKLLSKRDNEFWKSLTTLLISAYPDLNQDKIKLAQEKSKEYGFKVNVSHMNEFFLQFEKSDGVLAFQQCPWKRDCYTVHEGYFYLCPQSVFFNPRFTGNPVETDGLFLAESDENDLRQFIHRTQPLETCKICAAYKSKTPWRQADNLTDWIEGSQI